VRRYVQDERYFATEHKEVRRYVQDERYFAIEHMDVRCEAFQARTALKRACHSNLQRTVLRKHMEVVATNVTVPTDS
jgi:hypothetical protein